MTSRPVVVPSRSGVRSPVGFHTDPPSHRGTVLVSVVVLGSLFAAFLAVPVQSAGASSGAGIAGAAVQAPQQGSGWYGSTLGTCRDILNIPSVLLGSGTGSLAFTGAGPLAFLRYRAAASAASVATATSTAGGGATVVSTGGAIAGTAGWSLAAMAVGTGAFCGTVVGLENVFGSADEEWFVANSVDAPAGVQLSGLVPCPALGLQEYGDGSQCFAVGWDALPFLGSSNQPDTALLQGFPWLASGTFFGPEAVLYAPGSISSAGAYGSAVPTRFEGFSGPWFTPPLYGPASVRFRIHCADSPTCGFRRGTTLHVYDNKPSGQADVYYLSVNPLPDQQRNGTRREANHSRQCKRPTDGNVVGTTATVQYWEKDGIPDGFQSAPCPAGYAPTAFWLVSREFHGTSIQFNNPWVTEQSWAVPESVLNNSTTLACFLPRTTVCPIYDPDPSNPSNNVQVGGQGGVQVSPSQASRTVTTELTEIDGAINPQFEWQPVPDPPPTPSTTAVPPTSSTTTTSVPSTTLPPPPPLDPPNPPPPPGDPDFSFGACISDTVGDALTSVNLNPVTWVRALLYYMVAPIICAVLWLVVPSGGFGALFDGLGASLTGSELIGPVIAAVTSLQFSQCAPITLPSVGAIGGRTIDAGLCGNAVLNAVWAMFFMLGLLGLAKESLDTVAQFRRNQNARAISVPG